MGGAQPGQYFFRDGQIVVVRLVNHASYPIRIRFLQKAVGDDEEFNEITRKKPIVLQPFNDHQRNNRRSIGLGTVNVHVKQKEKGENTSEEILRIQATRLIDDDDDDDDDDDNQAWEEPNLVATFDVGYIVSCKKRDPMIDAMTKQFISVKLTPGE